jgi:3-dehydroquinate synthase
LKKITVEVKTPYTVLIERDALQHAGSLVKKYVSDQGQTIVITARPIRQHCGDKLEDSLRRAGVKFAVFEMRDGERHKSVATVEELCEKLAENGADRHALVLALGGGVVGDVGAFVASVYMRGVNVIQVPTTLVAMIDSAIGGKTGVNLKRGKNLVGTFHHPRAVLIDPLALSTLPDREYRSGLCEAIKYGIIRSRELFDFVEKYRHELLRRDMEMLERLIGECVRLKAEVVVADERESDVRRILNFGHTLGHALESATDYRYFLHGEAVAWGMIAACQIAVRTRRLDADLAHRINEAILAVAGNLPPIEVDADTVLAHTATDKKAVAGVLHFVLPREIGRVDIVKNIPEAVIREALIDAADLSQKAAARKTGVS